MTNHSPSAVRLESGPRTLLVRPGVGAAGHIVQRSDLTTHRVVVEQATLILVEDGRKCIAWLGGECVARPGEALCVQAGEVVDISNTPGRTGAYRALWMCWSNELLSESGSGHSPRSPAVVQQAALDEPFRAAFYRAFDGLDISQGDVPASVAKHRLQEVLLWLANRQFAFSLAERASLEKRVRLLISADPGADWSMERVADQTSTSVPTLRRKLSEEGVAFRDLVQDVRMSYALTLLQNTDVPVLHVANAAGYASPSRFSARFRARFGYLPTDVRGHNRGHETPTPR